MQSSQFAIRTRGLTKRYADLVAVDSLDLEIRQGEIFGLLGPNGAGKTTTILMLLGLTEPTEGYAEVLGLDPTRRPLEVKSLVGYLPDSVGFYGDMTGRENLRYTARLNRIDAAEAERRIDESLQQVGLGAAADSRSGTYSRGMLQRLGIADALVKRPRVLILDEPTVNLDPEAVQETLSLIRALPRTRGVTILLSSHLLHQVQTVCDRVAIFVKGRVAAQGKVDDLASKLAGRDVSIEVQTTLTQGVEETIRTIPAVSGVAREGDMWVVHAARDVREDLSRTLPGIVHLRRRGADLDDIYRRYFEGATGGFGGGAADPVRAARP